jgi:hypothetical protein
MLGVAEKYIGKCLKSLKFEKFDLNISFNDGLFCSKDYYPLVIEYQNFKTLKE